MKKLLLITVLSALSFSTFAQKKITEGVVISKQKVSSENEEMQAQFDTMSEMKTITYFKDDKSRAEISNPMSGDIITITDSKKILVLMDNPALGKMYMLENVEESQETKPNIKVVAGTKTKTILGYKCKQYTIVIKQEASEDMEMEMYTTEAIPVKSQHTSLVNDRIKGFPLYIVMKMTQLGTEIEITTEVTEIKAQEVGNDKFNMTPPEGYKNMEDQ